MTEKPDSQVAAGAEVELRDAAEALYRTFAAYPLRDRVEGCPRCIGEEDIDRIHSKPLRQLTTDDAGRCAFHSLYAWGGPEDLTSRRSVAI